MAYFDLQPLERVPPALGKRFESALCTFEVRSRFLGVQLAVELDDVPPGHEDCDDGATDGEEDQTTSHAVQRLLVAEEEVGREPMTEWISERQD